MEIIAEATLFVVLVCGGALARIALRDIPNFAPVAALALLAGFHYRYRVVALAVPLCVMCLSDALIGGYDVRLMLVVYAMLALPVFLRGILRRWIPGESGGTRVVALGAASVTSSVSFFLVTNLAVWVWSDLYAPSLGGLATCYAAALPFFRYTLFGDLFFTSVLFGSYGCAASLLSHPRGRRQSGRDTSCAAVQAVREPD